MLKAFAVYDVKAASFGNPMFVATRGVASRLFTEACADARSPMSKYPADYTLFEIGEYDPNSGILTGYKTTKHVLTAAAALASVESAREKAEPLLPLAETKAAKEVQEVAI